jgi:uncharacterized spore protein YtfJ
MEREVEIDDGIENMVEQVAARLGATANGRTIFGEPVREGNVTVVPVARVRYGFGLGRGAADHQKGGGGGGGVQVTPAGYIEIREGKARFREIHPMGQLVALVAAGGATGVLVLGALRRLLRARS